MIKKLHAKFLKPEIRKSLNSGFLLLFFLTLSNQFYGQNSTDIIHIQEGAIIIGEANISVITSDKASKNDADLTDNFNSKKSTNVKQSHAKSTQQKMLTATKTEQAKKIQSIKASLRPSNIKFKIPVSGEGVYFSSIVKEKNMLSASHQYAFANKSFELKYFAPYIYRDLYIAELPKFSRDFSNLISGRAPPALVLFRFYYGYYFL